MKQIAFVFTVILLCQSCKKQEDLLKVGNFMFDEVTTLPGVIDESSGLEVFGLDGFWSHNDRNGNPELYRFNIEGQLVQTLGLSNVENTDWEDLAEDESGNLYVGDFGNNDNDREDLVVYKIANDDIGPTNNAVSAAGIFFSFPDQEAFPPAREDRNFDVESMFAKGDFLYLVTRDRTKPFIGKSKLYRLPNTPGTYVAKYLDSFLTDDKKSKGQITAADLSPDGETLAMISNTSIWLFQNINGEDFFQGDLLQLDLPIQLDMEGLVFKDSCTIYLSNEKSNDDSAILYRIEICK